MLTAIIPQTLKHYVSGILTTAAVLASVNNLQAEITTIKEAMGVAMKHDAITAAGENVKLYSLSAHYNGKIKLWRFQFFNTGANLHNITVNKSGKTRHSLRSKKNTPIFEKVDFSKLPAPHDVLIDGLMEKGHATLTALNFKPANNGNLHIRYEVRSDLQKKNEAYHAWSVTIPIADGTRGKTVTFRNGKLDTVTNSVIHEG